MRWCHVLLTVVLLECWSSDSDAARILGFFHFQGKSHFIMYEALFKGLVAKGHEVVVVSHFPQKNKLPNYTDLSVKGVVGEMVNNFTVEFARTLNHLKLLENIWEDNIEVCRKVLEHYNVQNLIKCNQTFDLIVTEIFGVDCGLGFAHKFNVPIISMVSSVALPWVNDRVGNPDNPSYIPSYFLPFRPDMSFSERLINTVYNVFTKLGHHLRGDLPTHQLLRKHFGDGVPPLSELTKRTSLLLVNSHFSINQPRPTTPAFVEVGGLHIPSPQILPKDLKQFLDEATDGVIYFSFGSMVKGETLPEAKFRAFVEAFKAFPQRVLWKADGNAIPGLPPNVKTATWLPQFKILDHPNVRVFITHGGLMSSQEAVYTGVPMLGIPLFSDQKLNILGFVHRGMAVYLDYDNITTASLHDALAAVLQEPSYRQNAKRLSAIFRDRPQSALDTAIYWTEYVIRHGGAPHLRSAAVDLPLHQYLLLDVIAVLLLGVAVFLAALWIITKKLIYILLPGKKETLKLKQKLK